MYSNVRNAPKQPILTSYVTGKEYVELTDRPIVLLAKTKLWVGGYE